MAKQYRSIKLGALQVDKINKALGTELDPGDVWISALAHEHIAEKHGDEYEAVMAAVREIVASPFYVGQDPKHGRNFYIVKKITGANFPNGLLSISLKANKHGGYNCRTCYSISDEDLADRRAKNNAHRLI